MARIHDVSIPIVTGGVVYPGNPPIKVWLEKGIPTGARSNVSGISFGAHSGTHVDAAKHFYDDGQTVDELPLERLIGPAVLLEFGDDVMGITRAHLEARAAEIGRHTRVLFKTRNSALQSRPEFVGDFTYIAPDAAEWLVARGTELVGLDYLSVEQYKSGNANTHLTLLGSRVVIIEGLALSGVRGGEYELICLPLKVTGIDGAPARAVLVER